MGTLFSLMDMSRSALLSDQAAMDITSSNVANQNTAGYSREAADWQATDSVTLSGMTILTQSHPSVQVSSQRDLVLESRLHQQTQIQGQSGAFLSAMQSIQNVFGLTANANSTTTTALGAAIDGFFNSASSLSGNPSDTPTRQAMLQAATTLAQTFNSSANVISQTSADLGQKAADITATINALTTTVASLNQQIGSLPPGADAGVLEDQRQEAILQISQYIGLTQQTTEQRGVTLTSSNGDVLVSGDSTFAVQASNVGGAIQISGGAQNTVLTGPIGGQLGGLIEANNLQIPSILSSLDQLAYGIANAVNAQNAAGSDGTGAPGGPIFNLPTTAPGAASQISVAITDPAKISAAASGAGPSDNKNVAAMADLAQAGIIGGQTASVGLSSLLTHLGNVVASASADDQTQQTALAQLTTERASVSGVSLDQEAADLSQYQRSYQAAAKVFTIADSLIVGALNLGVQTAVS